MSTPAHLPIPKIILLARQIRIEPTRRDTMLLLNSVVDLLVPLYAVLVAVILLSFSRHSKDSRQNVYIYTPDKGSGAEPKNWKERLDGYW